MIEPWEALYRYWLSKHVDGRPPSRREIDPPLEIPRLIPSLLLVDALPSGFKYRLVGTEVVKGAGLDMTGMHVGESGMHSHVIDAWADALKSVHAAQEPRLLVARFAKHVTASTALLLLPLSPAPDGVAMILGGLFISGQFPYGAKIEGLVIKETVIE